MFATPTTLGITRSWSASPDSYESLQTMAASQPGLGALARARQDPRPGRCVREQPAEDSKAIAQVDWAILRLLPGDAGPNPDKWLHVRTSEGHDGWIDSDDAHSPVGYRAGFQSGPATGRWRRWSPAIRPRSCLSARRAPVRKSRQRRRHCGAAVAPVSQAPHTSRAGDASPSRARY